MGKGDLKHSKFKKNNEKVEKYYTNEGTNQKHRSPNRRRGSRQTPWKIIQNNDSKDYQKTLKTEWKMQESINKDLEEVRSKHTETNNEITKIKNTLEGISIRISEAKEWTSELGDIMVEITPEEQNKVKRMKRTEDSLRDLWNNIKCTNIQIIGVPEEEEKKKESQNFCRDHSWKFPQHRKGNSQSSPRGAESHIG